MVGEICRELYMNNLAGPIPKELGGLKSLLSLDLYHNNLTGSIPSSLSKLSNLKFLWASSLIGIRPEVFWLFIYYKVILVAHSLSTLRESDQMTNVKFERTDARFMQESEQQQADWKDTQRTY